MTKRISSETCEGQTVVVPDGRYLKHGVEVTKEDDPGYEEIDYTDCTEITVPSGRYVKHVVDIGGGGGTGDDVDLSDYYTKVEVDALLAGLDLDVDLSDYYDKTEIDALLDDYYTKVEVDEKFDNLDTAGVNVVGTTFSGVDDIKTQQDVNNLLYGMILDGTHSEVSTKKVTVSDEQFAADNGLTNQEEINVYLDGRLTEIESVEGLDPSFFVTKPELLASQKEQDAVIGASFQILEKQVLAIENDLNHNNDEDERIHSDLYAKIDELAESVVEYDDFAVRELIEAEKAYRIDGDAKLAAGIVEEARTRADEDFKLLARINGLEIPEMPSDYDDSGLRELIEQESALRISGDAALMQLVSSNTDRILDLNNDLAVERQDRVQGDLTIQAELRTESDARQRGDSDLQAQIDALEIPENFEEIIARIDNDIQVTNQKVDFNAEETVKDQERQDQELADYKVEVQTQQDAQDLALENYKVEVQTQQDAQDLATTDLADRVTVLENAPPTGGAEYLGELKDVDITGLSAATAAITNEFDWSGYRFNPGPGQIGIALDSSNHWDTLVLHKTAVGGAAPLNELTTGSEMSLVSNVAGKDLDEVCTVVSCVLVGDVYQIDFTRRALLVAELSSLGSESDAVTLKAGWVGGVPDPTPEPTPDPDPTPDPTPPPSVTAGTFLGYDSGRKMWVPQDLDVSDSVTDLSDYYTKSQVDAKIDAIDVNVDLSSYYTKDEVDQLIADIEIPDVPDVPDVDLSNYLTKDSANKVATSFRLQNESGRNYISTFGEELGLFNLKAPDNDHHAARLVDVTTGDAETLQAAKDYADAIDVDVNLDDYYTKAEVDASQTVQDTVTASIKSEVEQNASDIAAIAGSEVYKLDDLADVDLSLTRITSRLKTRASEELLHPNRWDYWVSSIGRMTDKAWAIEGSILALSKVPGFQLEWDDFVDNLRAGAKIHCKIQSPLSQFHNISARYEIQTVTEDSVGNQYLVTLTEVPTQLIEFTAAARNGEAYELTVSISEVSVEEPDDINPDDISKVTDVLLGYDATNKLWTPHKADYITLGTNQTVTGNKDFTNTIHFDRASGTYIRFRDSSKVEKMKLSIDDTDLYRLQIAEGNMFKIVTQPEGGSAQQIFRTYKDGRCRLQKVADPTNADDVANRKYVDERKPVFRWKYVSHGVAENLAAGEFFINSSGHIYIHPVTSDGVDLSVNASAGSISGMNFKQLASVHASNGNTFYMCTWSEMKFNNTTNKYIKVFMHTIYLNNTTTAEKIYHLNIPGFTF